MLKIIFLIVDKAIKVLYNIRYKVLKHIPDWEYGFNFNYSKYWKD